jgi:hypothetical protein
MTDDIENSDIKKWDVHFRGSDKVLCVEAEAAPEATVRDGDWLQSRDGGVINLTHVLAIVPHVDIDEPIPYVPTDPAPAIRPNLRDIDGDIWVPGRFDELRTVLADHPHSAAHPQRD